MTLTPVSTNESVEFAFRPLSIPTIELEDGTILEAVPLETASPKPTTAWENFVQNWAWIQDNDEEEEVKPEKKEKTKEPSESIETGIAKEAKPEKAGKKEKKEKIKEISTSTEAAPKEKASKFEPIGLREYLALGIASIYITALSIIFRDEPIVATSLTGGVMAAIKLPYGLMTRPIEKNVMRSIALVTLIAAITVVFIPKGDSTALAILSSIPLSDAAMAVFIKSDLAKLKIEQYAVKLLKKIGLEVSKKNAKIALTATQAAAFGALMNPRLLGPFIAAGCAVLNKAHMRRMMDEIWKKMKKIEDPNNQNLALIAAYGTALIGAALSVYAMQQDPTGQSFLGFMALLSGIITVDTLIRTAKNMVKAYEIPEEFRPEEQPPTLKDKCIKALQTACLLVGLGGLSWGIGDKMTAAAAGNPGLVVTVCQEAVGFLKVATKRTFRSNVNIPLAACLLLTLAAAGLYLFKDSIGIARNTPGYGAALFLVPCFITLSLYLMKGYLLPPKKGKEPKIVELDMVDKQQTPLLSESPV